MIDAKEMQMIMKIGKLDLENKELKRRIRQAIKYIEENRDYWEEWHYDGADINIKEDINNIENILKGIEK